MTMVGNTCDFDPYVEELRYLIQMYDDLVCKPEPLLLPAGDAYLCSLHMCRSICNRAERSYIRYLRNTNILKGSDYVYLNLLGNYFNLLSGYQVI